MTSPAGPDGVRGPRLAWRFEDYLLFLRRHGLSIVVSGALGCGAAAAWASAIPNRYEARARVLIERPSGGPGGGEVAPAVATPHDPEFLATEYQLILSRPVLDRALRAITRDDAPRDPISFVPRHDGIGIVSLSTATGSLDVERGLLRVIPVQGTQLADIVVISTRPTVAARLANTVAETYVQLNLERRQRQVAGGTPWLREEVTRAEGELKTWQEALQRTQRQPEADPVADEAARRQVELRGELLGTLAKRLKELEVAQRLHANNVQIIDPAELPDRPVSPHRFSMIVWGGLVGLALGGGVALLRELLTTAIRIRRDLEELVDLPFLGHVIRIPFSAGRGRHALFFTQSPNGVAAESLRAIRTTLEFLLPERPIQRVLITSSLPQEGKTTVSANLAVALQELGRRVVLIDADMRRPALFRPFQVPLEPGLSTYLQGQATVDEILQTPASAQGVTVITSGATPPRPADLLASPQMTRLLDQLGASFQYILVDTPPVIAVADATILSRVIDSAVLVVRSNRTAREVLVSAHRILTQSPLKFLATILNDVRPEYEYQYYRRGSAYYTTRPRAPTASRAISSTG
ncbi:MAG: polysaccharide biosynthesis tyrosine autokinase [Candidatus Omnitrophica bacterium]|nr:polysaccharide biosynthesis tyrosine autokinase [Candidatus Omnitrophota bacterium]